MCTRECHEIVWVGWFGVGTCEVRAMLTKVCFGWWFGLGWSGIGMCDVRALLTKVCFVYKCIRLLGPSLLRPSLALSMMRASAAAMSALAHTLRSEG